MSRFRGPAARRNSLHEHSSGDSTATTTTVKPASIAKRRTSFTRSRSPAVTRVPFNSTSHHRHISPAVTTRRSTRQNTVLSAPRYLLPAQCRFQLRVPLTSFAWTFSIDTRKLVESVLLLSSLLYAAYRIARYSPPKIPLFSHPDAHTWLAHGACLCITKNVR